MKLLEEVKGEISRVLLALSFHSMEEIKIDTTEAISETPVSETIINSPVVEAIIEQGETPAEYFKDFV